jgi:spermidine/putrescine transport system substrate-binding protein
MDRLQHRGISRRDFLRRSATAAVGAPSLAAILAACSKPGQEAANFQIARPDNPVTLPMTQQPIPTDTPIEKDAEIQLFNWQDYMWKYVIRQFITKMKPYGTTFTAATTFQNEDEAVQKLQGGDLAADVYWPTIDILGKLVAADLLQPLNHDLIPNLKKSYWDVYQDPYYDKGWRYSVPYTIYTTGIGYRRDHIPDDVIHGMDNPWEILWDPQYKDKVGVYPSYRDTMAVVLMKNGIHDLNTAKSSDLELVRKDLLDLIPAVNVRISYAGAYAKLPKDVFWLMTAWSGDMNAGWSYDPPYTQSAYENIGYWFPEDRIGPVDNDIICIPKNAPHPRLAHEFINYWIGFNHAMDNFSWNGYQPPLNDIDEQFLTTTEGLYSKLSGWAAPVPYVLPWMPDVIVKRSDFDTGLREGPLPADVDNHWHDVWQEFTAGVR